MQTVIQQKILYLAEQFLYLLLLEKWRFWYRMKFKPFAVCCCRLIWIGMGLHVLLSTECLLPNHTKLWYAIHSKVLFKLVHYNDCLLVFHVWSVLMQTCFSVLIPDYKKKKSFYLFYQHWWLIIGKRSNQKLNILNKMV